MKQLISFFLISGASVVSGFASAQAVVQGQQPVEAHDAQRRADLRQMLQQRQDTATVERQLNVQERADLREALRRQHADEARARHAAIDKK